MTKKLKGTKDEPIQLVTDVEHGALKYRIAYKTVGNTPFFKTIELRQLLGDLLDQIAVQFDVKLYDVTILDSSVCFSVVVPLETDLKKLVFQIAQKLIRGINDHAPELNLKQMAPNRVLSRLWHRPYYVCTLDGQFSTTITHYLEHEL